MSITSFITRDVPDLAKTPIVDWPDVRPLIERYDAAEVSFETLARALQACRAAIGNYLDESATSRREHDQLEAERQRLLEEDIKTDLQRARVELIAAQRALTPVMAAADTACVAARLPERKRLIKKLLAALDVPEAISRELRAHTEETARLRGRPHEIYEQHACAEWFAADPGQKSALEDKRRMAEAEGLL